MPLVGADWLTSAANAVCGGGNHGVPCCDVEGCWLSTLRSFSSWYDAAIFSR